MSDNEKKVKATPQLIFNKTLMSDFSLECFLSVVMMMMMMMCDMLLVNKTGKLMFKTS